MNKSDKNKILQISEDGLTVEKCLDKTIESIAIPEKIFWIDKYAFSGCKKLKTISFPNSLRSIFDFAFSGCSNLESLDFSKTKLWYLGTAAFEYCHNLRTIHFSESITSIERCTFRKCSNLSDINSLPQKEINIADNAFEGCPISDFNHQSLNIKNNLVIKDNYITSFTNIQPCFEVKAPNGIDTIQNEAIIDDGISELHIGEGIKIIKPGSIICESLLLLKIPASLERISNKAFEEYIPPVIENCSTVKMRFKGTKVLNYDENINYSVRDGKFVIGTSKDKITLVYASPDYSHHEIEIPSDITNIEYDAFRNCNEHFITLPDSIIPDIEPEYSDEEQECICGENKFMLPSGAKINRYFKYE